MRLSATLANGKPAYTRTLSAQDLRKLRAQRDRLDAENYRRVQDFICRLQADQLRREIRELGGEPEL